MDAKMAQEGGKGGSDRVDMKDDLDATAEPGPTRTQALQTSLLLRKSLAYMDDPAARELEAMLGSFGRMTRVHQMRSMEKGEITDFFTRK
jgi:hypothetical protein